MEEVNKVTNKKTYNKKNEFKFNIYFNNDGETLEQIIERAFRELLHKNKLKIF